MSHLRRISIELNDGPKIVQALRDLGIEPQIASDLTKNTQTLHSSFGLGNQRVAIAVQRDSWHQVEPYAADGIGFAWNGSGYDLVQDGMDGRKQDGLGLLRQRYAFLQVAEAMAANGWEVSETQTAGKQIELVFRKYS